jgi:predicted heme/steroid binding protein/uncharacterized membrane protein
MKEFDQKSLAEFNGSDGKPVYIAYQGKVFDVSGSKLWKGGLHMKRHHAGNDLTVDFQAAPHEEDVLERYPQVGIVKEKTEPERPMPAFLSTLIQHFPMLERHPHPITVHFPIVFLLSVVFFDFLYLVTGNCSFEVTALHCLIAGILFLPVAAMTGLFTWWLNYLAKPVKPVMMKIILSSVVFILSVIVLLWRMADPGILDTAGIGRVLYCLIIITFVPMVSAIGALGASLTFPVAKK